MENRPSVQLFAVTPFDRRFKMGTWVGSDFGPALFDSDSGRRDSARDILLEHFKQLCVGSIVDFDFCFWSRLHNAWVFRFYVVPETGIIDKFTVSAYVQKV